MTHHPIPKKPAAPDLFRLWYRDSEHLSHWYMALVGTIDNIDAAYADVGIHFPDAERLILPAEDTPCGPPKPCTRCGGPSTVAGRNLGGEAVLLCWACFEKSKPRLE